MVESAPIRGLWCASLTPLGADGRVDCARLAAHVHGLAAQGVDGIVLFGTSGEGASFSVADTYITSRSFPAWRSVRKSLRGLRLPTRA